jgi:CRISPR/Cas system-associated protein Csx1
MMSNLITMKKLLWISLAAILVLASCTTQKRKGELSGLGKAWHNTTAHYNGYFNAEELVQQAFVALDESHQDNYSKLLPMYAYMVADNPLAIAGNMDTAIKKVTIVLLSLIHI